MVTRRTAWLLASLVLAGCGASSRPSSSSSASGVTAATADPGASAAAFVQASPYTTLEVTVDWAKGVEPDPTALAFLESRLAQHLNKPGGVHVALGREVSVPATQVWSVAACQALEKELRTSVFTPPLATIYVLYLPGESDRDPAGETTLGWGTSASSFDIFKQTIVSTPQGTGTEADLEGAVLLHETGHLLGLVGRGAPLTSAHEDLYRPGHCTDAGCVMGASSATWDLTLAGGADFDAACVADLQALGGR